MEEWRTVFEKYKVSNTGRVINIRTNKELKKYLDRYGYHYVGLWINNKTKFKKVHRLVAQAFLSDYSEDLQVNHKNDIKTDNNVSNLEMCTNRYNCNYGKRKLALAKTVIQETLDGKFIREWPSIREIERTLGFCNTTISSCCKGYLKDYHRDKVYPVHQAFGYKWKYK